MIEIGHQHNTAKIELFEIVRARYSDTVRLILYGDILYGFKHDFVTLTIQNTKVVYIQQKTSLLEYIPLK